MFVFVIFSMEAVIYENKCDNRHTVSVRENVSMVSNRINTSCLCHVVDKEVGATWNFMSQIPPPLPLSSLLKSTSGAR
jgi:hypothetical protein